MIHSRPGFVPRTDDQVVAKLQPDMIPAINRTPAGDSTVQPSLEDKLANRTKGKTFSVPKEVMEAAARDTGPELILNPKPSATPQVLKPGK
jgi:hypothetical protein